MRMGKRSEARVGEPPGSGSMGRICEGEGREEREGRSRDVGRKALQREGRQAGKKEVRKEKKEGRK